MNKFSKIAILGGLVFSISAFAEFKAFTNESFDSAMKNGKTVIVDFHASWCPVCKKQEPLLKEIIAMKGYEKVVAFKADFDSEKDFKKSLNVSKQSTIIVFKAGKEVTRQTGITAKDELKGLLDKGL